MSDTPLNRREFFQSLFSSSDSTACKPIKYPKKSLTMGIEDIGEIGKVDSLILEYQVMEAQNAFMADEIVNQVIRLQGLPGPDRLLRARKAATIAYHEAPKSLRDQWVLVAFCKDIGLIKSPSNPSAYTASALRPYIDDSIYRVLKAYATFEDDPDAFRRQPWYAQGLQFLNWNRRAASQNFTPGTVETFAYIIRELVKVGLFKQPDDTKVIPELED